MTDPFQNLFEDDFLGNLESKKDTVKLKEGERRIVSILFLDVSGFTKLSNTIDHEEVRDLIDKLFQVFTASIEKNGGYIDKYEGDAIMALFGAKVASEVDTHRAITTGLEIIEKLKKFNEYLIKDPKYPITKDQRLAIRIGINSGKVTTGLVGKGREGDFTVFGPAVNLAARMESSAPLNEIMVPKGVKLIVDDYFNFKNKKSIQVKGFEKKIETYLIDSKKDIQDSNQSKTPYIGNQKSVLQLSKIYQSSLDAINSEKAHPLCVGIQGDAGIGKSRLVNEFLNNMNEGIKTTHYIRSGADNITVKPYYMLITLIKKTLSISEGDLIDDIFNKMNEGIAKLSDNLEGDLLKRSEKINDRIGFLLGLNQYRSLANKFSGQDLKNEINQSIRVFVEMLSYNANLSGVPLILIFEDLHWADQGSLESISYILNTLNLDQRRQKDSDHHCVFIFDYREDFSLPTMIQNMKDFSTINLEPLNATDCHEMSKHFIEGLIIPDEVVDTLLEYSKGNPFFIEEWLKSLEGNIKWSHEDIKSWTSSIPDSLNSLIISRIDQLEKTDKQVLQNASVIGKKFYYDTLEALENKIDESFDIGESIHQLIEKSFLMSDRLKKDLYLFKNILTQQVSYKSVLRSNRKVLHGLIADILESSYKNRKEEFVEDISHHYYLSKNNVKAKEYLIIAIKKVKKLYALNLAKDYYQKLIEIYTQEHTQFIQILEEDKIDSMNSDLLDFFKILHEYSGILMKTGEADKSDRYLSIIESHIKDNKELLEFYGKICFSKGNSLFLRGDLDAAEVEFKKHLEIAKQFKSIEDEWAGRLHLSRIEYSRGNYSEAETELTKLIQFYKKINDSIYSLGEIYNDLGILSFQKGEFENSLKYFSKLEKLCTERNENVLAAQALGNIGAINNVIGNYNEAYNTFKKVLKINEDIGDYRILSKAHGNLGISLKGLKRYDEALQEYDFQIEISNRSGDQEGVGSAFSNKCNIYRKLGNYDEAILYSKKAYDIYSNMDAKLNTGISLANLGDAYFEKGAFSDSEKNLNESLQIFRDINSKANESEVLYYLGKKYFYNNEIPQAVSALNGAILIAKEKNDMNMLSKSSFLLSKSLFLDNNIKESSNAIEEAIEASKKIENKFLSQEVNLFRVYLKSNTDKDFSLGEFDSLNKDLDDKNSAIFYFLRWKISNSEADRKESISKFSNLYNSKPSFSYLYYLNLLKK